MKHRLRPRTEIGEAAWDALVEASPDAWLFHLWDLVEGLLLWDGREDASFAIVDADDRPVAVVPLLRLGSRGVAAPRHVYDSLGGPAFSAQLGRKERAGVVDQVFDHLVSLHRQPGGGSLRIRCAPLTPSLLATDPARPVVNPHLRPPFVDAPRYSWVLPLDQELAALRARYSETTRRHLRHARESDITIREGRPQDLDLYYRLHLETCRRTGAAPHPRGYFELVFTRFLPRGRCRILFAEQAGEPIAALNAAIYKAGACYWTGASTTEKDRGANKLLMDAQIERAQADGCRFFDVGEAFPTSTDPKERGLSQFKGGFGAAMFPFFTVESVHRSRRQHLAEGVRSIIRSAGFGDDRR
jgi:hypothetical protein